MVEVPIINECHLALEFIVESLAHELVVSHMCLFEVFVVKVVYLSLILLNEVLHPMKRLYVLSVEIAQHSIRQHKI
jgi:hypothetical protein